MRSRGAVLCALVLALAAPRPAAAGGATSPPAGASAADREAARGFAQRGFELMDRGDYADAARSFRQAEARYHAPTHWLYVARAEEKQGKLLAAAEAYERVLVDALGPDAPAAFMEAQASARAELSQVRARTPSLSIEVTGAPEGALPEVTVDGAAVASPADALPLDPGQHAVRVTAPGAPPVERSVELAEGEQRKLSVALAVERPPSRVPAYAALGLGAAGLTVGLVTGVLSLNKVSDLEEQCPDMRCTPDLEPLANSARTLGTVSTVAFVAGGVFAAAGVVLLVVRPGGGPAADAAASPAVRVRPGVGSLHVQGAF